MRPGAVRHGSGTAPDTIGPKTRSQQSKYTRSAGGGVDTVLAAPYARSGQLPTLPAIGSSCGRRRGPGHLATGGAARDLKLWTPKSVGPRITAALGFVSVIVGIILGVRQLIPEPVPPQLS